MQITPEQQNKIDEILQQLDGSMCEITVLDETGDFNNKMFFNYPTEALELIKEEDYLLKGVDTHNRELHIESDLGIEFFIKFSDLKFSKTFSLS